MSDCSTRAWQVPRDATPPNLDGTDELVVDVMLPEAAIASARTLRIRQLPEAVFVRRKTCTLTVEYEGYPNLDYLCSSCNKIHNAPRQNAFCPRCGARVVAVVNELGLP